MGRRGVIDREHAGRRVIADLANAADVCPGAGEDHIGNRVGDPLAEARIVAEIAEPVDDAGRVGRLAGHHRCVGFSRVRREG